MVRHRAGNIPLHHMRNLIQVINHRYTARVRNHHLSVLGPPSARVLMNHLPRVLAPHLRLGSGL